MKYILVTGANGGLALPIIQKILENGDFVFGLDISAPEQKGNYLGIKTDITNEESIANALKKVCAVTDHLDAIVNIAGIMTIGSLIEEKPAVLQKMIDVNLLGMAKINYHFFPLIEKGKGRIINFSSEYGKYTTIPFNALYTITKHAVESYSDGLRRELQYLGIPVVTIRPGAFITNMQQSTNKLFEDIYNNSTHYKKTLDRLVPLMAKGTKNAKHPNVLTNCVMKAIYSKKPKIIYKKNHNKGIKILSKLPSGMIDTIFLKMFK